MSKHMGFIVCGKCLKMRSVEGDCTCHKIVDKIQDKIIQLYKQIATGYAGRDGISGHDIARWEAMVEVLVELEKA